MLDPDPDEMNADPQPCLEGILVGRQVKNLVGLQLHFLILTRSEVISSKQECFISNTSKYCIFFFWRARVCWPLFCLCRRFCIFERCLDSKPESCCSKRARYQLSHSSPYLSLPQIWYTESSKTFAFKMPGIPFLRAGG